MKRSEANVCLIVVAVIAFIVMTLALFGVIPSLNNKNKVDNSTKRGSTVEGKGYDTPEKALEAYINGLNKGDMDEALSAFAIESYVENFDTKADLEWIHNFSPLSPVEHNYELSDGSDFDKDVRIKVREAAIMRKIYNMISIYTTNHEGMTIPVEEGQSVDDFWDEVKKTDFLKAWQNMKLVEFISAEEMFEGFGSDQNQKNLNRQREIYGCDDIRDFCAVVEIDGEKYYQFCECGYYNGRWYIIRFDGMLSGMYGVDSYRFGLLPCSEVD